MKVGDVKEDTEEPFFVDLKLKMNLKYKGQDLVLHTHRTAISGWGHGTLQSLLKRGINSLTTVNNNY